jgi:MoxR-like ATPase
MPESRRSFLPELRDAAPAGASPGGASPGGASPGGASPGAPDRRDGAVYVLDDQLRLAVDVALATGRPLLLRGEPGSGKSSLAAFLARNLGWRYYEHVVSSRTTAQDLLWSFDSMRRLADASAPGRAGGSASLDDARYTEPGVMWWALDRESALRRGRGAAPGTSAGPPGASGDGDDTAEEQFGPLNADRDPAHAVVLIDEIDKADPDVPNGLLVPLGSTEFTVTPIRLLVREQPSGDGLPHHLIVITTNEERELPPAFLRRCIVHTLPPPEPATLLDIARRHLVLADPRPADAPAEDLLARENLLAKLAEKFFALRAETQQRGERPPSTAEYLDALRVCRRLLVEVDDQTWRLVEPLVLLKNQRGLSLAVP